MRVLDRHFLSKATLQSSVFIQNLNFTNGPRLGCMGAGRFWQMRYLFHLSSGLLLSLYLYP